MVVMPGIEHHRRVGRTPSESGGAVIRRQPHLISGLVYLPRTRARGKAPSQRRTGIEYTGSPSSSALKRRGACAGI